MDLNRAYFYGVYLGDGFIEKNNVMLKTVDADFVKKWQIIVEAMTGKQYAMYKESGKGNHKDIWRCKIYCPWLVKEAIELTHNKSEIPNFIYDGDVEIQKAFLQGLMDSEGHISVTLNPL